MIPVAGFAGKRVAVFGLARSGLTAARALIDREDMDAEAIARRAMAIAADICVYTNGNITLEKLSVK